jgi:hypothetical protein
VLVDERPGCGKLARRSAWRLVPLSFQGNWERGVEDSTRPNIDRETGLEYLRCSFCGKTQIQVERLIAGPGGVYICNECVRLCAEVIAEEREQGPEAEA